jgi:hypothetical protein
MCFQSRGVFQGINPRTVSDYLMVILEYCSGNSISGRDLVKIQPTDT